jgi:hypothetical protein
MGAVSPQHERAACALGIDTEILRARRCNEQLRRARSQQPNTKGVFVQAGSKSLIGEIN